MGPGTLAIVVLIVMPRSLAIGQAIERCLQSDASVEDAESVKAYRLTFTTKGIAFYTAARLTISAIIYILKCNLEGMLKVFSSAEN